MAGVNVTRVVGPAVSGFLISAVGVKGAYLANLALYAAGLLSLMPVSRLPPFLPARPAGVLANLADGFRYVFEHRIVLVLLLYGLVPMFLAMPFQTLLAVFARDVWREGASGLGVLNAAAGIGGVGGSIYVAWRGERDERLHAQMVSVVGFGVLLALFAWSPWFAPAVALVFWANVFASIFGTLNNTAIQLLIPDHVRGRVSAFLMMSFSLPMLGTLPLSRLAEAVGAPLAVGSASLLAVAAALAFYLCSAELRRLDTRVRLASSEP
jgi:hypothetical protein